MALTTETFDDPWRSIVESGAPLSDGHNCKAGAARIEQQCPDFTTDVSKAHWRSALVVARLSRRVPIR